MDYFFYFWSSSGLYGLDDSWLIFIFLIIFLKLNNSLYTYKYFILYLLQLVVILYLGWLGFTLNFLILLVLYSTLVIIFWIFSVSLDDWQLKKEVQRVNLYWFFSLPIFFYFLKIPGLSVKFNGLDFFGLTEVFQTNPFKVSRGDFFILFFTVFNKHSLTFFFFIISLVIVCMAVVTTLIIKFKLISTSKFLTVFFNSYQTGKRLVNSLYRFNFWSFSLYGDNIKVY